MMNDLLRARIKCIHMGPAEVLKDLSGRTINEGSWWFYKHVIKTMIRSYISEVQCLVMAIILMV